MTNLYEDLNVARGASPEVIDAAYLALRRSYSQSTDAGVREQIEAAFEILGNGGRRAAYDASLDAVAGPPPLAATEAVAEVDGAIIAEALIDAPVLADLPDLSELEPELVAASSETPAGLAATPPPSPEFAPDTTSAPLSPPAAKGASRGMVVALVGMVVLLIAGVTAGLGIYLFRGDDGTAYPLALDDADYDLPAMGLTMEDLPTGFKLANEQDFDNAAWAEALDQEEPEAKQRQLVALGRVRNYVRFFQVGDPITHLGHPFQYASQSSLFVDETSAIESMRTQCDLPYDQTVSIKDVRVPSLADQSTSFLVTTRTEELGETVDTVICFRTGRIVHSIAQRGLEGTEDLEFTIRLAKTMLKRVDGVFSDGG